MTKEIILDGQSFAPYVEGLPKLDPRIKSVEKNEDGPYESPNDCGYVLTYESEGREGLIFIHFIHDQVKKPDDLANGEHTIFVGEAFVVIPDAFPREKAQQFIDLWTAENPEAFVGIEPGRMGDSIVLGLQTEQPTATGFYVDTIEDWVKEIMDLMPSLIKKHNEFFGIKQQS